MTTIREALQYRAHQLSQQIFAIKEAAKTNGGISPQHPDWKKYKQLKHDISIALTAIHIARHKYGTLTVDFGQLPSKSDFRKVLRENETNFKEKDLFRQHAPAGEGRAHKAKIHAFLFEAYQMLADLDHDLKTNPTRFAEAAAYAEQRRQEVANAK